WDASSEAGRWSELRSRQAAAIQRSASGEKAGRRGSPSRSAMPLLALRLTLLGVAREDVGARGSSLGGRRWHHRATLADGSGAEAGFSARPPLASSPSRWPDRRR